MHDTSGVETAGKQGQSTSEGQHLPSSLPVEGGSSSAQRGREEEESGKGRLILHHCHLGVGRDCCLVLTACRGQAQGIRESRGVRLPTQPGAAHHDSQ